MNILLIFFAIPLATIILSVIFETFINCPFKVAGIFFSIFIVAVFALNGNVTYLVAAIIYTIISFVIAVVVKVITNRMCNTCGNLENNQENYNVCNICSSNAMSNLNSSNINDLNTLNMLNNLNNASRRLDNQNTLLDPSNSNFSTNNTCRRYR